MKPADTSKPRSGQAHRPNKTTDDFLRWLRKKKVLNKQTAEEKIAPAVQETVQALMIWDDDGGQPD
jgi:hypothetical protein